jgi:hypothetical protein
MLPRKKVIIIISEAKSKRLEKNAKLRMKKIVV